MALSPMASTAMAEREPLWEIGLGGGALTLPDYRGADRSRSYPYPFVMPFYRGKTLRADERGIRGLFFESDRIKLDVSLDGSVPVSSDDNPARAGMPDLDPSFQVGPKLRFLLWERQRDHDQSLSLDLPVRAAFAIGSGLRHIGYTAYPNLAYRRDVQLGDQRWRLRLSGGPMWGSDSYHDYFYSVPTPQATVARLAYDADAGYAGTRFLSTFYLRDRRKLLSLYAIYDSVQGAVFNDSPLVKRDEGFTLGFVITWFLFKSDQMVETRGRRW